MHVYLVQHGEPVPKEQDIKRPLSEKGRSIVEKLANACAVYGLTAKNIYHSTRLRAKQTAEILGFQLDIPVTEKAGLEPLNPVRPFYEEIENSDGDIMIVGHLPFLERLVSLMITGEEDKKPLQFQQGGLVCLIKSEENLWSVTWTVFPSQPWIR
ncbi:MAG: phosphohistidine phosphatase SixA [Spirochaetes bacterium]|nr:phosphohistidine phosphatase SixA [Spirochaetota bacterium]